jgi:hypothetical protein
MKPGGRAGAHPCIVAGHHRQSVTRGGCLASTSAQVAGQSSCGRWSYGAIATVAIEGRERVGQFAIGRLHRLRRGSGMRLPQMRKASRHLSARIIYQLLGGQGHVLSVDLFCAIR